MFRQERVVIDNIKPQLSCGQFFIKRVVGEKVVVTAEVLGDGHDLIQAVLLFKYQGSSKTNPVVPTLSLIMITSSFLPYSDAFTSPTNSSKSSLDSVSVAHNR